MVSINISERFESVAVRILRDTLGVEVTPSRQDGGHDIVVHNGEATIEMALEFKTRVNAATARQAAREARELGTTPLMVVAGETTAEAREILRSNGVAYIDGLGNADVSLPGLVYRLVGQKPAKKPPQTRISGKAGRIAMKLLLNTSHSWHIKELAALTRVSPGFVHRVLARLDDEGILTSEGRGPTKTRTVHDPGALLDLWAEEQRDRIDRTLAYHLAPTSQQQRQGIVGALEAAGIGYALTGASAADLVAPLVTSVPMVQVWVSAAVDPQHVLASTPAEAVDAGHNVVFLQARDDDPLLDRQRVDDTWIVNDFRLYLDLRNDPRRGTEQANHLRQERIGF